MTVLPIEIVEEIFNRCSPKYYWKFLCLSKEHFKHFDTFNLYYNAFKFCDLQVPEDFKDDIYDHIKKITKYEDIKRFFKKYFMIRKNHDPKDTKSPKNCYCFGEDLLYYDEHGKGIPTADIDLGDVRPYYVDETNKNSEFKVKYKMKIRHKITKHSYKDDSYVDDSAHLIHEEYCLYFDNYHYSTCDAKEILDKYDTVEVTYSYRLYDDDDVGRYYFNLNKLD